MRRDRGPQYNIGFGVNSRYEVPWQEGDREGSDPTTGMVGRALNDNPVMRFFAVTAATAVSAGVAGAMIRGGGKKMFSALTREGMPSVGRRPWQNQILSDVRRTREIFDEWEGVHRGYFEQNGKRVETQFTKGFFWRQGELDRLEHLGRKTSGAGPKRGAKGRDRVVDDQSLDVIDETPELWTYKDELRQRMVRQARRLPYELPGAYMAQRLLLDPLFGTNDNKPKPNWYNPVDVLGDFAQQSMKNLATMLVPFDAGTGLIRHGWRRAMTYGQGGIQKTAFQQGVTGLSQFVELNVNLVGTDISEFLYKASKYTNIAARSMGAGLENQLQNSKPIMEVLHQSRQSASSKWYQDLTKKQFWSPFRGSEAQKLLTPFKDVKAGPIGLPTPFVQGARQKWFALEEHYAHREALLAGRNTVELSERAQKHFLKTRGGTPEDLLKLDITKGYIPGSGGTTIEQLAGSLDALGRGGPGSKAWKRSTVYNGFMNQKYKDLLIEQFEQQGVDRQAARRFTEMVQVVGLPSIKTKKNQPLDLSRRLDFGDTKIAGEADDWMAEFKRRTSSALKISEDDAVYRTLPKAIQEADAVFRNNRLKFEAGASDLWRTFYQQTVPKHAEGILGGAKLSYEDFGLGISENSYEFLLRRTAAEMGANPKGNLGDIRTQLSTMGFNPSDRFQLRSFLVDKKVIAKPWSDRGFNIFGLRRLTVAEGLDRGFFGPNKAQRTAVEGANQTESLKARARIHTTVSDIQRNIERNSAYKREFVNSRVGNAAWMTQSGRIIDMSPLQTLARRSLDKLASNFQIPLVKIKPLETLGYGVNQSMSEASSITFMPGHSRNPGLRWSKGVDGSDMDALFWMRSKRTSGKVVGLRAGEESATAYEAIGKYKPFPTDPYTLAGRNARIAYGDKGNIPDRERTGWRKLMSLDESQPGSIPGFFGRMGFNTAMFRKDPATGKRGGLGAMRRNDDINNPVVFARKLLDGTLPQGDRQALLDAWGNFQSSVRTSQMSPRVLRMLEDAGLIGTGGDKKLHDLTEVEDLVDFGRNLIKRAAESTEGTSDEVKRSMQKAESILLWRWLDKASVPNYFEGATGKSLQKAGISRRLEQFKSDMFKFMTLEGAIEEGQGGLMRGAPGSPQTKMTEMFNHLSKLRSSKVISQAEYSESRAALLSTQINLMDITMFNQSASTQAGAVMSSLGPGGLGLARNILEDIADGRVGNFGSNFVSQWLRAKHAKNFSVSPEDVPGNSYNPYSAGQQNIFVPTLGTAMGGRKWSAIGSALGLNSNQEAYNSVSLIPQHMTYRLNRYFSTLGMGLDETDFRGPLNTYAMGMVGKRVLPIVAAGTTALAVDRTAGGLVYEDENGDPIYRPLVLGGAAKIIAKGQMAASGVVPGGMTYEEKEQELLYGDVPIRKGRYWLLGNTPFRGGQVQYYRPSWYRRFTSGALYTDDTFGHPLERLAFGHDFSPLRPLNPYWFENKHKYDRPYPVSGEYFTGPWGPLTSALNATVGRVLKPPRRYHEDEVNAKLSEYQTIGQSGVYAPAYSDYFTDPEIARRRQAAGAAFAPVDLPIAGVPIAADAVGPPNFYESSTSFSGGATAQFGSNINTARSVSGIGSIPRSGSGATSGAGSITGHQTRTALSTVNQGYVDAAAAGPSPFGIPYEPGLMPPRILPGLQPISPHRNSFVAGHFGYEVQEMAGIYGFAFGSVREGLGFGRQDFTPRQPVLMSAGRAYGSERAFWDLNLGGLGDIPGLTESEYGSLEMSEIVRRFIPHRRRDTNEINPITNNMGILHPWLPGREYFVNFKEGDPFSAIPDGELRLPGKAYERMNGLHSDFTGTYGLVDKFRILGDVAPWSPQYRALEKQVTQLRDNGYISKEDYEVIKQTKRQVRKRKEKNDFRPYLYHDQDYNTISGEIIGEVSPGVYNTTAFDQPVRLAGVRVRKTDEAAEISGRMVKPGDKVSITYDANRPPGQHNEFVDAIVHKGNVSLNISFLNTYGFVPIGDDESMDSVNASLYDDPQAAYEARTQKPIDILARSGMKNHAFNAVWERISHRNTFFNDKFLARRTATEDWERENVYGSPFPQWTSPYENFIKPMVFKATTRNPVTSALIMGAIGRQFGAKRGAKAAGQFIGGTAGFVSGLFRGSEETLSGERFVPKTYRKQIAVEEYIDILTYVRNMRLFNEAIAMNDLAAAGEYRTQAQKTMYGADLKGMPWQWAIAVPKRKREHFKEMLNAPKNERERILSTAGRLERRLYQAAWGERVEERPELEEYFAQHELPGPDWEGWSPNVNMEHVKIKVMQSLGLDASQMGYYPQQVEQANLVNPSYPEFLHRTRERDATMQLRQLLDAQGVAGDVRAVRTPYPGTRIQMRSGVEG